MVVMNLISNSLFRPSDVPEEEYDEFYKALTKDKSKPFAHVHFVAEGEVSFKSLLYVPETQPADSFNRYGTSSDNIKVFNHLSTS